MEKERGKAQQFILDFISLGIQAVVMLAIMLCAVVYCMPVPV